MSQEESSEHVVKRQRTEEIDAKAVDSVRADAVVRLRFVADKTHEGKPEFTHQIFDNEVIPSYGHGKDGKITVTIDCRDLKHSVEFSGAHTKDEISSLMVNLSKALPDETPSDTDENSTNNNQHTSLSPPGQLLCSFQSNSEHFEIYRATAKDAGAQTLLHRAEKIAMWFIETADSVDFTDERWEVLFLFTAVRGDSVGGAENSGGTAGNAREFVGYITLFSFRNPIFGTKVRVCQALILPHWQSQGLGRELLLRVYDHVVYARDDVSELTVEDPCPGFQRLRDAVDFELLLRSYPGIADQGDGASEVPSEADIAKKLKVIKSQAQFLGECLDFFALVRELLSAHAASSTATEVDSLPAKLPGATSVKALEALEGFKSFRLKVKRRIVKNDKDLAALQPKSAMQQALSEEFAVEFMRFLSLQKTAVRLKVISSTLQ
jgi:GNAT superfamily N-acetyltransferase